MNSDNILFVTYIGYRVNRNSGATQFNSKFDQSANGIIRRECLDCSSKLHKVIYYRRYTPRGSLNIFDLLSSNWVDTNNKRGQDFDIFSTYQDALSRTNAWKFCNYNSQKIGFPGSCGPSGQIGGQWNSWISGGVSKVAYFIELSEKEMDSNRGRPIPLTQVHSVQQVEDCMEEGVTYDGFIVSSYSNIASATACQNICQQDINCNFFEWSPNIEKDGKTCWLKWKLTGAKSVQTDHWSGPRFCCMFSFIFLFFFFCFFLIFFSFLFSSLLFC